MQTYKGWRETFTQSSGKESETQKCYRFQRLNERVFRAYDNYTGPGHVKFPQAGLSRSAAGLGVAVVGAAVIGKEEAKASRGALAEALLSRREIAATSDTGSAVIGSVNAVWTLCCLIDTANEALVPKGGLRLYLFG